MEPKPSPTSESFIVPSEKSEPVPEHPLIFGSVSTPRSSFSPRTPDVLSEPEKVLDLLHSSSAITISEAELQRETTSLQHCVDKFLGNTSTIIERLNSHRLSVVQLLAVPATGSTPTSNHQGHADYANLQAAGTGGDLHKANICRTSAAAVHEEQIRTMFQPKKAEPQSQSKSFDAIHSYQSNTSGWHNNISAEYLARVERGHKKSGEMLRHFALAQGWIGDKQDKQRSRLKKIVGSIRFDLMCAFIIILNSILLGLSTDYAVRNRTFDMRVTPLFYRVADLVCNVWFLIELILRIVADGPCVFFSCLSPTWSWNLFDTAVVLTSILEVIMVASGSGGGSANISALRMLRVLRAARAVRFIRLIRLFKEFRRMVLSVLNSFATLMWALILLLLLIYMFSVFLAENVTTLLHTGKHSLQPKDAEFLQRQFDSLPKAMYTLFISVTGGISWYEISDPLFEIGWTTGLLFCFYVFFTLFAMVNIITAIFLESALNAYKNDHDEVIHAQLHADDSALRSMEKLFKEADHDASNSISSDEFCEHLADPRFRAHLANVGIEVGEAEGLFQLLDADNSGTITIDEFLFGCMRLKGAAKAVDVQTLLYENKKMYEKWNTFADCMDKNSRMLKSVEEQQRSLSRLLQEKAHIR